MKIAGIIAEYNPFHNGHKYQIEKTRELGATHIAVAMSGSFVQRGDIAVCSKWTRAKACLENGADLVVELPTTVSLSSANTFACGGVYILDNLNVDTLSFGSECGDINLIKKIAGMVNQAEASDEIKLLLDKGFSYPRALQASVSCLFGDKYATVMQKANNALAIEYVRAINAINPNMEPVTILREQTEHDSLITGDDIASATHIRHSIDNTTFDTVNLDCLMLERFMPKSSYNLLKNDIYNGLAPVFQSNIEKLLLFKLKTLSPDEFSELPDVSEGLENRLYKAAMSAVSINEYFDAVKTKRYTHARIRRIAYCALLGIKKLHQSLPPQYIRVLGANQRGFEILAKARKTSKIPVATKFATLYDRKPLGIDIDVLASDIYSLVQPNTQPGKQDFITNTIIKK